MRASILLLAISLASCGYTPPAHTDIDQPKYLADLDTCQGSVPDAVDRRNAKRGLTWMAGGVTRWPEIGTAMDKCMEDKGWGHTRACTADELRNGTKTAGLIVTRDGVRCSVPNKAS